MICFAIKRLDGFYFSGTFWTKHLPYAYTYSNEYVAVNVAERQGFPYKIIKVKIEEVEE